MKLTCICVLISVAVLAESTQQQPESERMFQVLNMEQTIYEQKRQVEIDAATAARMFTNAFPYVTADWQRNLKHAIEPAPEARRFSIDPERNFFIEAQPQEKHPRASVIAFSRTHVTVMVQRHLGMYLGWSQDECLAVVTIPRGPLIDAIFNLPALEPLYSAEYKGIRYGSSQDEVRRVLGEPDAIRSLQCFGCVRYFYFHDDIQIQFQGNLRTIERGVPPHIKNEVQKTGNRAVH